MKLLSVPRHKSCAMLEGWFLPTPVGPALANGTGKVKDRAVASFVSQLLKRSVKPNLIVNTTHGELNTLAIGHSCLVRTGGGEIHCKFMLSLWMSEVEAWPRL